jgi:hypothetical protein
MGAKFDEEDFQRILFKGHYETVIDVIPKKLTAKFRTLTGREYDEIDEIIALEIKEIPMTQDGLRTRTSMWVIAYGVIELNNKVIVKEILNEKGVPSTREMAEVRRKVFAEMAPGIVNMLIQKHGAISVAVNSIISNPDGGATKNS